MNFDDTSEVASKSSEEEKVLVSTRKGSPLTSPPTMFQAATQVDASDLASESEVSALLPRFL